ncbi:hypothetical protein C8R42DRAFT_741706 [Lentinula raphanica]|nr:hypothetical protein C8R42DRAFT_741706 [Lentinula raphanica]
MSKRSPRVLHTLYASRWSRSTSLADGPGFLYAFVDRGHRWKIGMTKDFARRKGEWDRQCPSAYRRWMPPITVMKRRRAVEAVEARIFSTFVVGTLVLRKAANSLLSMPKDTCRNLRDFREQAVSMEIYRSPASLQSCNRVSNLSRAHATVAPGFYHAATFWRWRKSSREGSDIVWNCIIRVLRQCSREREKELAEEIQEVTRASIPGIGDGASANMNFTRTNGPSLSQDDAMYARGAGSSNGWGLGGGGGRDRGGAGELGFNWGRGGGRENGGGRQRWGGRRTGQFHDGETLNFYLLPYFLETASPPLKFCSYSATMEEDYMVVIVITFVINEVHCLAH